MLQYNGCDVSTTTLHARGPAITEAAYVVRLGETVIRRGTVYGPFNSMDDAHSAAGSAARGWIDQQGKQGFAGS